VASHGKQQALRKKFSFPGFLIILFFATCLSSADAGLFNFLLGIDPSTYRRKLMAEIYLAIPVVYRDLPLFIGGHKSWADDQLYYPHLHRWSAIE
jgi:hypothetical protein